MAAQRPERRHRRFTAAAAVLLVAACAHRDATTDHAAHLSPRLAEKAGAPRQYTPPSDPRDAVREAASALAEHGTSRIRTSVSLDSGGTRIDVDGAGRFDYRTGRGSLDVRLPRGTSGVRPGERRTVVELAVPGALYMKNRGAGVPEGKWVRVATAGLSDGNLVTSGATDPVSAAHLLRGAREVTYSGTSRVPGGVRVRRYRGTLDLADAARTAAPQRRAELRAAARGAPERSVPFEALIDGQGRLRKVRHQFTFAGGAAAGRRETDGPEDGFAVASTTFFHGYGVHVRVEMPEPDDIYAGEIAPF